MVGHFNVIKFEKAKNKEWTCKVFIEGKKEQYIYSKYKPKQSIQVEELIEEDRNYIILGLGLGYEVEYVASNTTGVVYVIEPNSRYLDFISRQEELKSILKRDNIRILVGEAYESLGKEFLYGCKIINNIHLTKYEVDYYNKFIRWLQIKDENKKEKILVIDHATIAKDCIQAFKLVGYKVEVVPNQTSMKEIMEAIRQFKPNYIFSINFESKIASWCEELRIPYISWSVDTPSYCLYEKEVLSSFSFKFIYDKTITNDLIRHGITQVYHLPVAIDVQRVEKTVNSIREFDKERYSCDVSFVGNLTESEYSKLIKPHITAEDRAYIDKIIIDQTRDMSCFTVKESVKKGFAKRFIEQYGIQIKKRPFLSLEDAIAFLIGRYHSEVERIQFITKFSEYFKVHVYGNDYWKAYIQCYCGQAKHYEDMPKIFNLSKVNLNMTRCFVESGLPMRIFDVLGSRGFLITNYKTEIEENFVIGKDLVVYRDLQDALDITAYYLHHEGERLDIAERGYETIKENHTYVHRIKKMMAIVHETVKNIG